MYYWLNNSMPMGYQNHTTAWFLGGCNVHFQGFGYGTLDGNGQLWYDFAVGVSNYPRSRTSSPSGRRTIQCLRG